MKFFSKYRAMLSQNKRQTWLPWLEVATKGSFSKIHPTNKHEDYLDVNLRKSKQRAKLESKYSKISKLLVCLYLKH